MMGNEIYAIIAALIFVVGFSIIVKDMLDHTKD